MSCEASLDSSWIYSKVEGAWESRPLMLFGIAAIGRSPKGRLVVRVVGVLAHLGGPPSFNTHSVVAGKRFESNRAVRAVLESYRYDHSHYPKTIRILRIYIIQKIGQWLVKKRLKVFTQPIEKTQQFASGRLDGPAAVGVSNTGHQAHRKTPPYVAGSSSGVFLSSGYSPRNNQAAPFPRSSHPPPTGHLMAHRKACA